MLELVHGFYVQFENDMATVVVRDPTKMLYP